MKGMLVLQMRLVEQTHLGRKLLVLPRTAAWSEDAELGSMIVVTKSVCCMYESMLWDPSRSRRRVSRGGAHILLRGTDHRLMIWIGYV